MQVQFLKDTSKAIIPDEFKSSSTIVVYRDGFGYDLPEGGGAIFIEFSKYNNTFLNYNPENIIIIGLNRIINPTNRCDLVFEYLQENTHTIKKISIDTSPFIGEPWRFWYHYSITKNNVWNWPHGYFVETLWKKFFLLEDSKSPFSYNELRGKIKNTFSDMDILRTSFSFYEPDLFTKKTYDEIKDHAFSTKNTEKTIINEIMAQCSKNLNISLGFDLFRKNIKIEFPYLGICKFVANENNNRMKIHNCIISGGGHGKL